MAATYRQFLAAPSSSLLADTAALHYVTTTTTLSGPTEIIKHLTSIQKQVNKKKEEILSTIDGGRVVVVEVDTGLGFQTGGGPYLPGLDDNFLASRVAYLPITHIVTFDEAGKIAQIRLQWDQGSLLKQVEIIGKSGRNWPIRDSREQIAFIQLCLKSVGTAVASSPSHNEALVRARTNSTNAFRDPHASLQLFGPREEIESAPAAVISPYGGTRPQQRSFTEILGDEPVDGSPSANRHRSMSPSKGGQGKNFQPMRIFDGQQDQPVEDAQTPKAKAYIRPNPKKFSHFDFADGTDPQDAPQPGVSYDERPRSKHDSQWDFGDFVTPQKAKPSRVVRTQDIRHWDTDKDAGIGETPAHQQPLRPRRDAETHFELQDDGEPVPHVPRPGAKPRGYTHNEGLGLYKNQLFDSEGTATGEDRALGNITNLKDRGKDFDHHFDITDDSPAPSHHQPPHISEGRMKAVKMMDPNWSSYDRSPTAQKENTPLDKDANPDSRIHIAGDGMGGRKGTNRDWLYGGGGDDEPQAVPTRKPQSATSAASAITGGGIPGNRIVIAGDGMGGKKGTNRDWLYSETEEFANSIPVDKSVPTRKPGSAASHGNEPNDTRITIAGDGMGGRKGTDRDWLYSETDEANNSTIPDKSIPTRKPGGVAASHEPKETRISIAGDGMGGKKGTNRDWLYGDVNEPAQPAQQAQPARKQKSAMAKSDFWDF